MDITAIIKPGVTWQSIDPSDKFPWRWQAKGFSRLLLEAPATKPGGCWHIRIKQDRGKYRDGGTYPSRYRIQLLSKATEPSHEIEFVVLTGKVVELPECGHGSCLIPGDDGQWLILVVKPISQD
jgi:hypothetical protein